MEVPPGWEDSQPEVPVVFFDGVKEINCGNVVINVGLEHTQFVSNVCEKIGKSPHQVSIFLVKNPYSPAPDGPLVVPAKEDINFDFLCLQNDIIFLVVWKRLELMSRNPWEMTNGNGVAFFNELMTKHHHHDWPVRNEPAPVCRSFLQVLKTPRPKRVNRPRFTWGHGNNLDTVSNIRSSRMMAITKENKKGFCKDCKNAEKKGEMAGFDHPCVDNLEIVGFRTPVGPMALAMNDPVISWFRRRSGTIARPN
ncbi:Hypothetical predicted protein [Olea europaea subsp. europaea]|uniref:DUF7138 domain-containing protein n=1 Tax=Olea europaea subsp. europaea TaxID=158383 RepID=A0A8S0VIK5_OLEEU|nr:Hypothetical predicted protein [Olea europaea subsp. europaea]